MQITRREFAVAGALALSATSLFWHSPAPAEAGDEGDEEGAARVEEGGVVTGMATAARRLSLAPNLMRKIDHEN